MTSPANPESTAAAPTSTTLNVRIRETGPDPHGLGPARGFPYVHLGTPERSQPSGSLAQDHASATCDPRRARTGQAHMRHAFHEDLDKISDQLVEMTRLVGSAMSRATTALLDADIQLADTVIAGDKTIDAMREQIDSLAIDLLARQNPVA